MTFVLNKIKNLFFNLDWILIFPLIPITAFGLITMFSFVETNTYFFRQLVWLGISVTVFLILSTIDFKFLRRTAVITWLYLISAGLLVILFAAGSVFQGAQSWLDFGLFSFQPAELAKLVLVLTLAKYFSRRHIEIQNIRHIIVSGVYAFIIFILVLFQPDFGSAIIIFLIWLGMVLVSGISKKHLLTVFLLGFAATAFLWIFVFQDYQKARILNFIHPLQDIRGTGYNAYQSMVAVGSGQVLGKGVGYGTQSRLKFLPEYQTDFIFAAFSEEWGFIGVVLLFILYILFIFRILYNSIKGATNFEVLFGVGLAIIFISHFFVHIGMNIGVLPITGLTLPFMSYGGTNLLISFVGLGILMSMRRYSTATHRDVYKNEMVGV
jgi:rod shape determining protein RodA